MPNTSTVATLTARVRSIADITNSQFITNAEILAWLNVGLSELWDVLVNKFEDYIESSSTFPLVAGTSDYDLPTDFYKLLSVDYGSGAVVYAIPRFMNAERNRRQGGAANNADYAYRIVGNVIRFIPTPTGPGSITLHYAPQHTTLALDTAVVSAAIPQGWEELAVLDAAIQCNNKAALSEAAQALMIRKDQLLQRILADAGNRDANQSARVTDAYGRFYASFWDMDEGSGIF